MRQVTTTFSAALFPPGSQKGRYQTSLDSPERMSRVRCSPALEPRGPPRGRLTRGCTQTVRPPPRLLKGAGDIWPSRLGLEGVEKGGGVALHQGWGVVVCV